MIVHTGILKRMCKISIAYDRALSRAALKYGEGGLVLSILTVLGEWA